jgi:hypothetical protein
MPFDTLEIRISLQKLLIGLILVIVPLSVVGLYLTSEADTSLEQTIGAHFRSIAQTKERPLLNSSTIGSSILRHLRGTQPW